MTCPTCSDDDAFRDREITRFTYFTALMDVLRDDPRSQLALLRAIRYLETPYVRGSVFRAYLEERIPRAEAELAEALDCGASPADTADPL